MDEELKDILKKQNEMLEEILQVSKKTRTYIIGQQVMGVFKLLIFVIPVILGIIYLPGILSDLMKPYQELLNMSSGVENAANIDPALLNEVSPDLIKKFMK